MHTKLEVDVYSHWSDNPPVYRIYVNNEMLIERTFVWPSYQNYIREHIYCDLDTGVHTLCLENLDSASKFELKYFQVGQQPVNKNLIKSNGAQIEWRFIVDTLRHEIPPNLVQVSHPTPIVPVIERPRKIVQENKYSTYIPLVQRARQLNTKK